jgi:hypothetical protein
MRGVLLVLLASCSLSRHRETDVDEFGRCRSDASCDDGDVCARNGACYPSDEVRAISVTWTLDGMAADSVTCANTEDLSVQLSSPDGGPFGNLEFAPVPCRQGKFSVDKLPTTFRSVVIRGRVAPGGQAGQIDAVTGEATIDLRF